jgi:glycosyltransferase involved in cell wall biosynthesis
LRVSVALCTYNGERFLPEQLASIAAQECPPEELVVCDDGSQDRTCEIVGEFARRAPFEVRFTVNESRLGVASNFSRAMGLCRGEWIALADQDDVWTPHKLRRFGETLAANPAVRLLFSDADAIDAGGRLLGYRLWQAVGFSPAEVRAANAGRLFQSLLRRNVVTGATLMFHAGLRDLVLSVPEFCQHDAWLATLIAAVAPAAAVEEPLLLYRQHGSQVQGERNLTLYQQYRIARSETAAKFDLVARRHAAAAERLDAYPDRELVNPSAEALRQKAFHFQAKSRMRSSPLLRLPLVMGELARGRYSRYSRGWKSLAQDLLIW